MRSCSIARVVAVAGYSKHLADVYGYGRNNVPVSQREGEEHYAHSVYDRSCLLI